MAKSVVVPQWLVIVLLVSTAGFSFVIGQHFEVVANTTTQTSNYEGWQGGGNPAYPDNGQAGVGGGLLDQTDYIASWSPNLIGQRVSVQGSVVAPTSSLCPIQGWGYRIELVVPGSTPISGTSVVLPAGGSTGNPATTPNTVFTEPLSGASSGIISPAGQGRINMPAVFWDIVSPDGHTTIPEGSVVHAELWAEFLCPGILGRPSADWRGLASDEARVHTGIGSVAWNRNPALYQVGETAVCSWMIGYISDPQKQLGWSLTVSSAAQSNRVVASNPSLGTLTGSVSYRVTVADWSPNQGKLLCDLKNNLWSKDFALAATVDNTSLSPSLKITGIWPQSPKQGQTVIVNWTAAPNAVTNASIDHVEIVYGWGGPTNDVSVPGNTNSYSFIASQSGYVTVAVNAWDSAGRPSGFQNLKIQVDPQPPFGGLGGGASGGGLSATLLMLYLFIVAVGFALYLVGRRVPGVMGIGLTVLGVVLLIAGVFLAAPLAASAVGAWIQGVANPFG